MSLTPPQSIARALLRGRRSPRSWIAGSAVLAPYLARQPGDLDIHHPDARAHQTAIRSDLAVLLEHGFAIDVSAWQETERWAQFRHDIGLVVLNWVVVEHPETARPQRHPDFGYAVPIEDAVAEKLETAQASGRPKDVEDLRAISRAGVPLPPDLRRRLDAFMRGPLPQGRAAPARRRP